MTIGQAGRTEMIEGIIADGVEAIIQLELVSIQGEIETIPAVIDTGFTSDLTLPPSAIHDLGYPHVSTAEITLADGSIIDVPVFEGLVIWFGVKRTILIVQTDSDALVGMSLMNGCRLTMDVIPDGHCRIVPLPNTQE
jgi:clan AA aspartic protease